MRRDLQPATKQPSQTCAANSLFRKILPVNRLPSRFWPDRPGYPSPNSNVIKNLATSPKKCVVQPLPPPCKPVPPVVNDLPALPNYEIIGLCRPAGPTSGRTTGL